jgi:hypothetical protein
MIPRSAFLDGRTGASIATGRPRFVTTTGTPVSETESMSSRHFALNSAAEIVAACRGRLVPAFMTMTVTMVHGRARAAAGSSDGGSRMPVEGAAPTLAAGPPSPAVLAAWSVSRCG